MDSPLHILQINTANIPFVPFSQVARSTLQSVPLHLPLAEGWLGS